MTSAPKKDASRKVWRSLDSAIAAVLVANVLLLAAIVAWPVSDEGRRPDISKVDTDRSGDNGEAAQSGGASKPRVDESRLPLLPRNELWQRSQRQAAAGQLDNAIDSLQQLLRQEPRMGEVPKRAVWLQLSYLAGTIGREEDAARWLRLSKASIEGSLVPEELLRLAREASSARDWSESRRYAARFLLQQGMLAADTRAKVAEAYMLLADGYRDQADVPEVVDDDGVAATEERKPGGGEDDR